MICFALALHNGRDPFLKERLFGLSGPEGNHGEDVKELYFYQDATPTSSYLSFLYKYPQAAFPYQELRRSARSSTRKDPEIELLDTGVFDEDRYFDVGVEYAKQGPEDIFIRIEIVNRGPDSAEIALLPTIWFRNTWSWGLDARRPKLKRAGDGALKLKHHHYGRRWLFAEGEPELLFTENETNQELLFESENLRPFVKDGIDRYVVGGEGGAVNPDPRGTKASLLYRWSIEGGGSRTVRLRLTDFSEEGLGEGVDRVFAARRHEADQFYGDIIPSSLSLDAGRVMRQALAGLLWSRQYYFFDVSRWLKGDPAFPKPPRERRQGRNRDWTHLYNEDVVSMPDKWEYPWYAAWDLAFHCVPLALADPDFAKDQLVLMLREWYMHPNGQLPAYEWNFGDVNPPVHAWAAWRIYKIEGKRTGRRDRAFLERIFHKLLLNFTWWVNRKDTEGRNIFQGGFLGLDNIGVFNRSEGLPGVGRLEQSDATSWMGMYCLNMLAIALELAIENPTYEDVASKFFEHFVYICRAMNRRGPERVPLWDAEDGFYYDHLRLPGGRYLPLKVRSLVGLIPLFAVEILDSEVVDRLPRFKRRMQWFLENRPELADHVESRTAPGGQLYRLLALVNPDRLRRVLRYMLDEEEFLSPFGVRSLSRYHRHQPYVLRLDGQEYRIDYEPAESTTPMFGGNSNWRGPIWFPVNFLLVESLQRYHHFLGDRFRVSLPSGSERTATLAEVSREISRRLCRLFLRNSAGQRPIHGGRPRFQQDPHFRDHLLFHEFFHGDTGEGLGASHQTGWTALVAKLLQQCQPEE